MIYISNILNKVFENRTVTAGMPHVINRELSIDGIIVREIMSDYRIKSPELIHSNRVQFSQNRNPEHLYMSAFTIKLGSPLQTLEFDKSSRQWSVRIFSSVTEVLHLLHALRFSGRRFYRSTHTHFHTRQFGEISILESFGGASS